MFAEKPKAERAEVGIPAIPHFCGKAGCQKETKVALVRWRSADGSIRVDGFSDVGYRKRDREGGYTLHLRAGDFESWLTRCSDCYSRDLYLAGKGGLQKIRVFAPADKVAFVDELIKHAMKEASA